MKKTKKQTEKRSVLSAILLVLFTLVFAGFVWDAVDEHIDFNFGKEEAPVVEEEESNPYLVKFSGAAEWEYSLEEYIKENPDATINFGTLSTVVGKNSEGQDIVAYLGNGMGVRIDGVTYKITLNDATVGLSDTVDFNATYILVKQ